MDFQPTATWATLQARAALLQRLRQFFDKRGFLEVETPLLSRDTVVDLHLDPLPVDLFADPCRPEDGRRMWLQTSPEFAMKRLLATGAEAIFQVTKAFRAGEQGSRHNPEFTLVEWYRVGDDLARAIALLSELAAEVLDVPAVRPVQLRSRFSAACRDRPAHRLDDPRCATRPRRSACRGPRAWKRRDAMSG